jgi:tRNA pseudouridine13 synthase
LSYLPAALPDWQRAFGGAVATARLKLSCADFEVTETLGFVPGGDGEHDYLWVEKEQQNTPWVAGLLARHAGLSPADVGYSGLKDRQAVTRQWFSVRRPGGEKPDWSHFRADGVRILEVARHGKKLKRGAHRANRFRIVLRDLDGDPSSVIARLTTIREQGMPNYFGGQRFGHDARNLALANKLFSGRRLPRNQRSMALSAARSYLFNLVLERRVVAGTWNTLVPGDSANLDGSGSIFRVGDVDEELLQRVARLDLHATGPLWGSGEPGVAGSVSALEASVIGDHPGIAERLKSLRVGHARRALRARVSELRWQQPDERTLSLEFTLGRGVFATSLLRELVRTPESDGEFRELRL